MTIPTITADPDHATLQKKSLEGIRVLDMSRVLAGPFCASILADLGADVIKIESPWGDDSRAVGPFFNGESAYYRLFNRSKKGITLDLKNPTDVSTFLELVKRADVLIENFRPGVMAKLGVSPEKLLAINPQLIVTSISGFGQTGSMAKAPAYDIVAQAMSGLMSVTGHDVTGPTRVGVSLGDLIPGLYGAIATLGALAERAHSHQGQHVDIAMFDSLVSILESVGMRAVHTDEEPKPEGNDHAMTTPFSTYQASDGLVVIAVLNEKLFGNLATALELDYMLEDPRFNSNDARRENRALFRDLLEEKLSQYTASEAIALLREHGVPTSPVQSVSEALHGPIGQERQVLAEEADGFTTLASPIRLTGSVAPSPAPKLGEHNHLIESWLAEPARGFASAPYRKKEEQ